MNNNANSKTQNAKNYIGNLKQSTNKSDFSGKTSGTNGQNAKNEQGSSKQNCR